MYYQRKTATNRAIEAIYAPIRNERVALAVIVTLGLVARVAMTFGTVPSIGVDSYWYLTTAKQFLLHWNFQGHQIFHGPLYPMYLASFLYFGETPAIGTLIIIGQRIIGLATVVLVYRIARRVFGPGTAFLAALLFALDTDLLYFETVAYTESLFVFTLTDQRQLFFPASDH